MINENIIKGLTGILDITNGKMPAPVEFVDITSNEMSTLLKYSTQLVDINSTAFDTIYDKLHFTDICHIDIMKNVYALYQSLFSPETDIELLDNTLFLINEHGILDKSFKKAFISSIVNYILNKNLLNKYKNFVEESLPILQSDVSAVDLLM